MGRTNRVTSLPNAVSAPFPGVGRVSSGGMFEVVGLFHRNEGVEVCGKEGLRGNALVVAGVAAGAEVDEIWESVQAREGEEVGGAEVVELCGMLVRGTGKRE